ncbi:MAG: hypothetical protein WB810_02035, partial [Candidatus Cybelea sp.]
YLLCLSIGIAMLAGCGGSQLPIGAPGAAMQSRELAARAALKTSSGALIYATNLTNNGVWVFSYPSGLLVAEIPLYYAADLGNECVDSAGNVFVAARKQSLQSGQVFEIAHGGTSPIADLADPQVSYNCAVDPTTSTLAVTGNYVNNRPGVAFYKNATGAPTILSTKPYYVTSCTYDSSGNLYIVAGNNSKIGLLLLPAGSKKFQLMRTDVSINGHGYDGPTVQWANNHLTVSSADLSQKHRLYIYELTVNGSKARKVHTTELATDKSDFAGQVWVQGAMVLTYTVGPRSERGHITSWRFPNGGHPINKSGTPYGQAAYLWGLVVSQ